MAASPGAVPGAARSGFFLQSGELVSCTASLDIFVFAVILDSGKGKAAGPVFVRRKRSGGDRRIVENARGLLLYDRIKSISG